MENVSVFKKLTIEQKRDHIWKLFSPIIDNLEDGRRYLETFLLSASDEKLDNFYEAMMSGDKEYVNKLITDIKSKKTKVKELEKNLSFEVMNFEEKKEKETTEQEIDEQLGKI